MHRLKILLAKLGLDGHDRGIKIIARTLRDEGYEVVYLGRRQAVDAVVATAIAEDVDVVGISVLSGTHMETLAEFMTAALDASLTCRVVAGGTILRHQVPALLDLGVDAVFPVGTPLPDVRAYFAAVAEPHAAAG
jgi:methylmalonyl-CoA mutase C-terminal domain/subunit